VHQSIDAQRFCTYFNNSPHLECPGHNFPVDDVYVASQNNFEDEGALAHHVVEVLFEHIVYKKDEGDVLVFLSSAREIDACVNGINSRALKDGTLVIAYPLYSQLDDSAISAAKNPDHRDGLAGEMEGLKSKTKDQVVRKVVCCTNIAETSLTIDKIRFVIDAGQAKKLRYDHRLRCTALVQDWVSHASTVQRKGRAGRTSSGVCYHLYSEDHHNRKMSRYDTPAILEKSVDELILLSLSACQRSIEELGLLDTPNQDDILSAKERLLELGFIEKCAPNRISLTNCGRVACDLSHIRPESVRVILNACEKFPECARRPIKLAVILSTTESIFDSDLVVHAEDKSNHVFGDHLLALEHFEWFEGLRSRMQKNAKSLKKKCLSRGLNFNILASVQEDVETCYKKLKKRKLLPAVDTHTNEQGFQPGNDMRLLQVLTSGYFHHAVKCLDVQFIEKIPCSHLTVDGVSTLLDKKSFLNGSIQSGQGLTTFIDDEARSRTLQRNDANDIAVFDDGNLSITTDKITPRFLLYGSLTKAMNGNVYMLDASVIEGWVIEKEAPRRWLERVCFNKAGESKCRITMRHIGPFVLKDCREQGERDFFKEVQDRSGADLLHPMLDLGYIVIVGSQASVDRARTVITDKVQSVLNTKRVRDKSHNKLTGFVYGLGMSVTHRMGGGTTHEFICAYGTDEAPSSCCNVAEIRLEKKGKQNSGELVVLPIRNTSMDTLRAALDAVDLDFTTKREKGRFVVRSQFPSRHSDEAGIRELFSLLGNHEKLVAEMVTRDSIAKPKAKQVFDVFGREAYGSSTFWREACLHLDGATVCFIPTQGCFAFGPRNKGSQASAKAFRNLVDKLTGGIQYYDVTLPAAFERYQIRRFLAILAELKKANPSTLFALCEVQNSKSQRVFKVQRGDVHSDYEWLMHGGNIKEIFTIRIWYTALVSKHQKSTKALLQKALSPRTLGNPSPDSAPRDLPGFESRMCVRCRRIVVVSFSRNNANIPPKDNATAGWRLTLCGCCYCLECFRHAAMHCLEDDHVRYVQCLCCRNAVLAKDCFEIIGKTNRNKEEWNQLCRLADARYCQGNVTLATGRMRRGKLRDLDRQQHWATCPDCGVTCVYPGGYRFFICRNTNCRSKMCTRCRMVATEECVEGQCRLVEDED